MRLILAIVLSTACLSAATTGIPVAFEANRGQADSQVRYFARSGDHTVSLASGEATFTVRDRRGQSTLHLQLAGSAPEGAAELPGKMNYLLGNDAAHWQTNIPTYGSVVYRNVNPGVDLLFHGGNKQLEYDIVVSPGADARLVRLLFSGAKGLKLDGGDLLFRLDGGRTVRHHRPAIYQETRDGRRAIAGSYRIRGRHNGAYEVTFDIEPFDTALPLVIDPVLSFTTFFGGASNTRGNVSQAIALDTEGNVYITGNTDSGNTGLPVTPGAVQPTSGGSSDVFVAKLDASGTTLLYCTYLGGADSDAGLGIAVDASGNAYVAGETRSTNFPVSSNAFQKTYGGGSFDAFAVKLNPTGTALLYSSYLGGSTEDHAYSVALDPAGAAYLTGSTNSTNFPVLNAYQAAISTNPNSTSIANDIFVTKISAAGAIVYSTYYGGASADAGKAIFVDSNGFAYVTGSTSSTPGNVSTSLVLPTTAGTFTNPNSGLNKALCSAGGFILRLNPNGSRAFAACFGGLSSVTPNAILANSDGFAAVAGGTTTGETSFPLVTPLQAKLAGKEDAFLALFDTKLATLAYSTYLGGTSTEKCFSLAGDDDGNVYIAGWTDSDTFPTVNALPVSVGPPPGSDHRSYISKIAYDGQSLVWSTFFGATGGYDELAAMAVDASGNVYATGSPGSKLLGTTGAQQPVSGSAGFQSFVTRIGETPVVPQNGLLGAAAFTSAFTPGAIVSLYGSYLSASTLGAAALPLPTKLAGTIVKVNGVAAPLYYSSPHQVNFQLPYETTGSSAQVTVTLANLTSSAVTIPVASAAPGIFTADSSGKGQGIVVNSVTNEFAAPAGSLPGAKPIAKGQFITIYASGLGAVTNPPASGAAASGTNLSNTVQPVTVNLGTLSLPASFAGLVPGLAGLYQVNVQIPTNAASGNTVSLTVTIGGTTSNTVTLAIAP